MATLRRALGIAAAFVVLAAIAPQPARASFTGPTGFATGVTPYGVAIGDVTGDGRADLVVADLGTNEIKLLAGDGTGSFAAATTAVGALPAAPSSLALGDLDGDGDRDLAIAHGGAATGFRVFKNDPIGTFAEFAGSPYDLTGTGVGVALGNLDGDGDIDAVVTTGANNMKALTNNGAGAFTIVDTEAAGTAPWLPVLADFSGDSILDAAYTNKSTHDMTVAIGAGNGTFSAAAGSPVSTGAFCSPGSAAVADIDRDGRQDVVVPCTGSSTIRVMKGDGAGGFATMAGSPFAALEGPAAVLAVDFDRDGNPDVASVQSSNDGLRLWLGNGAGTFTQYAQSPYQPGSNVLQVGTVQPNTIASADLNGDTMADIVVPNNLTTNTRVLLSSFPVPAGGGGGAVASPPDPTTTSTTATTLAPRAPQVRREGGAERYSTAVHTNKDLPPGIDVAYVTTGENFPDALATGPVAGIEGAALLLVQRDAIPADTASELERLRPDRIVIVGGISAVSAPVQVALGDAAESVSRISGLDRYGTALALSRDAFPSGASIAYIVSGDGFAEAVASGPAAGLEGGPILLVHGTSLDDATADELRRLDPSLVVIAGGTESVSRGIEADISALVGPTVDVEREGGADRYDTGAALAARVTSADTATLFASTGEVFADGLAATPWAIRSEAPILLVPHDGDLPASVLAFFEAHPAADVIIVGGTAAVSDDVLGQIAATRA